jgi:hypothetical protein
MAAPAVKVEVEFAPPTWTDISAYVRLSSPFTATGGRSDTDERVPPGRLSGLTLRNTDGRFTVGNASGAYYPNVTSGKRVRYSVQNPVGGAWVVRWTGYVDGWPMWWEAGRALVSVSATDALQQIQTPLPEGRWLDYVHTDATYYWPFTDNRADRVHAESGSITYGFGGPDMSPKSAVVVPVPTDPGPAGDPRPLPVTTATVSCAWTAPVVASGAPLSGTAHTSWAMTCLFKASTPTVGYPIHAYVPGTFVNMAGVHTTVDGHLRVGLYAGGSWINYGSASVNICDGRWWWLTLRGITDDGYTASAVAYPCEDPASITTAVVSGVGANSAMFSDAITLNVGEYPATLGHVSWGYDSWDSSSDLPEAFVGLATDSLAGFGTMFNTLSDFDVTVVEPGGRSYLYTRPIPGTLTDMWAQAEDVDGGVTHAMPDGTVRYLSGAYKDLPLGGSATPALDLDATTVQSLRAEMDRLKMCNDITVVCKAQGVGGDVDQERAVSTDSGSITASGRHAKTHEAYGNRYSGGAATIAAELLAPTEAPRIPEVEVNALTLPAATQSALLSGGYAGGPLNVWDLLTVTDMPAQGSFPDWLGRIEGWTETIGAAVWSVKFNTTYSGAVTPTGLYPATDLYPDTTLYPEV